MKYKKYKKVKFKFNYLTYNQIYNQMILLNKFVKIFYDYHSYHFKLNIRIRKPDDYDPAAIYAEYGNKRYVIDSQYVKFRLLNNDIELQYIARNNPERTRKITIFHLKLPVNHLFYLFIKEISIYMQTLYRLCWKLVPTEDLSDTMNPRQGFQHVIQRYKYILEGKLAT